MNTKNKPIEELKRFDAQITKAVRFLVDVCLDKNGNQKPLLTDKPLVMHSLRVAFRLLEQGYGEEIVIAAVLHDLPEDAGVKIQAIKEMFGSKIAKIVSACSFDESIEDEEERYKELFGRVKKEGKEALVVKAADIFDNSNYLRFVENARKRKRLLEKWNYFLRTADEISDEPIYQELLSRVFHISRSRSAFPQALTDMGS